MFIGTQYRDFTDCRQHGCSSGECIRQGSEYVCKQGMLFLMLTSLLIKSLKMRIHFFLSQEKEKFTHFCLI